eukprot:738024-Pelagomonas_calceolata.AAC.2
MRCSVWVRPKGFINLLHVPHAWSANQAQDCPRPKRTLSERCQSNCQFNCQFTTSPPIESISIEEYANLCQMGGGSLQPGQADGDPSFHVHTRPNGSPFQHAPQCPFAKSDITVLCMRHKTMLVWPGNERLLAGGMKS